MRLRFNATFKSIRQFPDTDLPLFTIITGPNGAGKSHLLKAIASGAIVCDAAPSPSTDAQYLDWATMVPADQPSFDPHALDKVRANAAEVLEAQQGKVRESNLTAAAQIGIPAGYLVDVLTLANMTDEELGALASNVSLVPKLRQAIKAANGPIRVGIGSNKQTVQAIEEASRRAGVPLAGLRRQDIYPTDLPDWGETSAFQQSFSRLFATYRKIWRDNQLRQLREQKTGQKYGAVSDEEFVEKHGSEPWAFVNETFVSAGLDFEVNSPPEYEDVPYKVSIKKKSDGTEVKFGDLSSGERIIMSLALCMYYAEDERQISRYPKLLLLGEIDAPLHPAMSRDLLNTIQEVLVARRGVSVMLVTHSPSTVALAPAGSTYMMSPGVPGLRLASKDECLNALTVGVPTLAISYEGRRQVMVESSADAAVYGELYQVLRERIDSERSLDFVATSTKGVNGELNSGVDVVTKVVGALAAAGNKSVFGLVDWDGIRRSDHRLFVLAEGRRNGLENLVLDPLLAGTLVVRQN